MMVDDSCEQLQAFKHSLRGAPYRVFVAENYESALAHIKRAHLVIIDYHMPDMLGDECLRRLKIAARDGDLVQTQNYYLYTTDRHAFRHHRDMGFDGVLMLKGKASLRGQVEAIERAFRRGRNSTT